MKKIKLRGEWRRKPQTQVVPNKKALRSKYSCRKGKGPNIADPPDGSS